MHPSHSVRPQNMQHHLHQPTILQRPPPVGISVGPQMHSQQHHLPNVPHPGGHQQMLPSYVPPQLRDRNRVGQRFNSQMHHGPMQSKFRSNITRNIGVSNSALVNQIPGSQPPHNVQSYHQMQGLQHKSSSKPIGFPKQKAMQKTTQVMGSQQVMLSQPSTSSHQKIAQQQIGSIDSQHNTLSQQGKGGSSVKTMGIKHSQSNPYKISPSSQGNPIRNAHLQTSTHSQSANKPFQPPFKFIPTNKSYQSTCNRPNNAQSSRTSPPQKIQSKHVTGSSTICSIITPSISDNASVPNSKCNIIGMQPRSPVVNSTTVIAVPSSVAHNSVSNTTSNAHASLPGNNVIMKTPQGQQLLHSSQNTTESQNTSDNQIITQTSNQSPNSHVPPFQQELQVNLSCGNSQNSSMNESLANTKEKTPMCLVNELARYNKIQHQYRLTSEQGPAHCKRFTVTLKLGDEDYTADGLSIKKAQHAAASEAISKTRYMHPPMKTARMKNGKVGIGNITPTVELNALLMKLGEPALYVSDTPEPAAIQILGSTISQSQNGYPLSVPNQNFLPDSHFSQFNRPLSSGMFPSPRLQRFPGRPYQRGLVKYNPRCITPINGIKELSKMTLVVGKHKFVGIGMSPQLAKHDAATKALEVLKPLVSSKSSLKVPTTGDEDPNAELKSPISLVHETALKRDLQVSFEVKSERGEPHMKTFVTLCKVGDLVTDGEGNGKKISKKRAAEKMLEELKKLPPLSPSKLIPKNITLKTLKKKPAILKRKAKNLIKENSHPEIVEEINPISKLIQLQQALKAREPMYTLVEEIGAPRRREFVIEVSANGKTARGTGSNKKMAKKVAARNLLMLMGYENGSVNDENHAQVINGNQGGSSGRQIVPGLLLMQHTSKNSLMKSPESVSQLQSEVISSTKSAKNECNSTKNLSTSLPSNIGREGVRPKDQLLYLAQLLGFQAVFSDYPKGNHGEYLTIVTLSTDPPQICHGAGSDTDQSQDKASITALQMLSELGLDNVKPKKSMEEQNEQTMIENSKK